MLLAAHFVLSHRTRVWYNSDMRNQHGLPSLRATALLPATAARATKRAARIYGNVRNNGSITNLPDDEVVEAPCRVDGNGVHPVRGGAGAAAFVRWACRGIPMRGTVTTDLL
jgi:alpha-galactosidase/6-phospho-beta-glucosidase family protein